MARRKQFNGIRHFVTHNVTEPTGRLTIEDFNVAYDIIMSEGASPDYVFMSERKVI